nr:alanine:cation symporter family protein [Serratia ureilytica]
MGLYITYCLYCIYVFDYIVACYFLFYTDWRCCCGPGYVQTAMESVMPGFGSYFVAIALFFFAFTTIVAYYYIAKTNVAYLNRKIHRPWLTFVLKIGLMASAIYGTVKTADMAWGLGDIGMGLMAWLNIIAILLLRKTAFTCLKDYEA